MPAPTVVHWTQPAHSAPAVEPRAVLFVARSLERGGAERQLVALVKELQGLGWRVSIACFYAGAALQHEIEHIGVDFHDLRKRGRWEFFSFIWRYLKVVRRAQPDIIHGYMPVSNMLASLACIFFRHPRAVWGVRASNMALEHYNALSRFAFQLECALSRLADMVISNSEAGAAYRISHGFPRDTMHIIPNGIDTERFKFDAAGRDRLRREWRVPDNTILIGMVARLDPMKDHDNFLRAAVELLDDATLPPMRFICIGGGPASYRRWLGSCEQALGLAGHVSWTGARDDMSAVYSALDIVVLPSAFGEGFSNVIGEAMACERRCVVTDVGDSAAIVGDCGRVVAPGDRVALAGAIRGIALEHTSNNNAASAAIRERIVKKFSTQLLGQRTAHALASIAPPQPTRRPSK